MRNTRKDLDPGRDSPTSRIRGIRIDPMIMVKTIGGIQGGNTSIGEKMITEEERKMRRENGGTRGKIGINMEIIIGGMKGTGARGNTKGSRGKAIAEDTIVHSLVAAVAEVHPPDTIGTTINMAPGRDTGKKRGGSMTITILAKNFRSSLTSTSRSMGINKRGEKKEISIKEIKERKKGEKKERKRKET